MVTFNYNSLSLKQKYILIFSVIILLSTLTIGYIGFTKTTQYNYDLVKKENEDTVKMVSKDINVFMESIPKDLKFLSSIHAFQRYMMWKSIGEENVAKERKIESIETFRSFLESKKYIYQIRYIDLDGVEQLSIKYDNKANTSKVLDDLQDKSQKAYFKIAKEYNSNEIYISSMDLNQEHHKLTYPYIPVVRFSIPLINSSNVKQGVFVINAYAEDFLARIRKYDEKISLNKQQIFMVDNDGFYLFNKDEDKLWGKDLKTNHSLKTENINLYKHMQDKNEGFYEDNNYIYTYEKIYPMKSNEKYYWILFTKTDKENAFKDINLFKLFYVALVFLTLLILAYFINKFISNLTKPLFEISNHLDILAKGQLPKNDIVYNHQDEIGKMIESLKVLSNSFSSTIEQTKLIADGDYSKRVKLLSSKDALGISINNMTEKLKINFENDRLNKWFSDGLNDLSRNLTAEMSFEELSNISISFLCRYLKVGKGVFYIFDEKNSNLFLSGSYMHTKRDTLGNIYELGEGSIGQVAIEKSPILLTNSTVSINLALNDFKVKESYTYPLIYEKNIYGVLEILSQDNIDENTQEFVHKACEIISTYLYSVKQRDEVNKLLEFTKISEEKLRIQSEELQESNTQMQEQQQQLEEQQQQLEEANAQMEEQRQQLEANSEILKEKNRVLQLSQKELDKKAKDLELSNKYKSEFLANMSHELRTPLNSIILLSDMLATNSSNNLSENEIKKANVINKSGNELLKLINDVLDLSKVEAGKMELILDEFSSTDFINDIKDLFEHTIQNKNLELKISDSYNNIVVNDRDKLSQVIKNLMSNAIKFTKNGAIELITSNIDGKLKISVKDSGIGIPLEKQKLIFEAFSQADGSTSREYGGTGLGLSICKELVKLMGGEISLESKDAQGSTFSVIIPNHNTNQKLVNEEKTFDNTQIKNISYNVEDDRENLLNFEKAFLIIEDDEALAKIVKDKINESNEKALIAHTGKDGLELANDYNIIGVMLDLGLPDIDGIDLLKEFKTNDKLKNIPIHIISGKDIKKDSIDDIDGFSSKPITNDDIKTIIKNFKEKSNKDIKNILIVEDNLIQRETIVEYLSNPSISPKAVGSLNESIDELNKNHYDCVILDLNLTDGSGYKICEYIDDNNLNIPIIIYTGKNISSTEEQTLRKYTDTIIIKTVASKDRLLDELDNFLFNKKQKIKSTQNQEYNLDLSGKKIVVADDDIRNIYVLSELLESKGAEVISANNGEEAIVSIENNLDSDLIILDIMMPVLDGYEVAKRLKGNDKTKNIPIIALTAKAMSEDKTKALEAGCDDYLTKPIDVNILANIIKAWLKKNK